jgi:hypothetical protein
MAVSTAIPRPLHGGVHEKGPTPSSRTEIFGSPDLPAVLPSWPCRFDPGHPLRTKGTPQGSGGPFRPVWGHCPGSGGGSAATDGPGHPLQFDPPGGGRHFREFPCDAMNSSLRGSAAVGGELGPGIASLRSSYCQAGHAGLETTWRRLPRPTSSRETALSFAVRQSQARAEVGHGFGTQVSQTPAAKLMRSRAPSIRSGYPTRIPRTAASRISANPRPGFSESAT